MDGTRVLSPLNGTKTHPLSEHALAALRRLLLAPVPAQEINCGVVNRLQREDLAKRILLPSPYKTSKGKLTSFLEITDAGRGALSKAEGEGNG